MQLQGGGDDVPVELHRLSYSRWIGLQPMSALTRCLEEEAAAIAAAAQRLPADQVEAALQLLDACAGQRAKLVITGVGKSGIVARKIAATFA